MEFHFRKAWQILVETIPYVLIRLLVYGLAILVTILWFGGIFLLFIDWPFPGPPWLAWVIGGVLYGSGAKLVRAYVLYLVKAAHISVITRLAVEGRLPEGTNQLGYGKDTVLSHFLRISVLFAVDRLVTIVLKAFNRSVFKMLGPIPGISSFRNFVQRVLDYSVGYVDEAILSYSLLYPRRNPWDTAREGLVLYAQNWKTILGSGAILALLSYALVVAVAAPGVLVAYTVAGPFRPVAMGVAIGLGLLVKFAFMDPFALTSVIVNYHAAIAGQVPDPSFERQLESVSRKFKEFRKRASSWESSATAVPPPPPPGSPGPVKVP